MEFMYLWEVLNRAAELYRFWKQRSEDASKILSSIFNWGLEFGEVSEEEFQSAMEFGTLNDCWDDSINEIM